MNDFLKRKKKKKGNTKTCLKLLSSFKPKGRESKLCTQNYWSEALLTLNLQETADFPGSSASRQTGSAGAAANGDFRARSRGRSRDGSTALSHGHVRDLGGDLLLSPEAIFASNMPQCCFCFLQTSGECGTGPPGNGSRGLCEGRSDGACQRQRNAGWTRQALLWQTPPRPTGGWVGWDVARLTYAVRYYTDPMPPMLILARFPPEVKDNGISG